ncbi:MAG: hypothetical protein GY777_26445, partial [Candidatus Brocadiaceae bacterium]|nr:hypothetical protein [Candidatus Brocadiaceae bacterium]
MMSSFNMFLRFCGSGISSSFLYFHLKSILALALTAFMYTSTVCAAASTTNITWTDIVGVTIGSNTITKSAAAGWGNGGAASQEKFTGNGGISFTVTQEG